MFSLIRPSESRIRRLLDRQHGAPFSYPEVGATRGKLPGGYPYNYFRGRLGSGQKTFERAAAELRGWHMYALKWARLCWPETPVVAGAVVAVLARSFGLWSVDPVRVVYVLDETGGDRPVQRYAFAIGTLPGHTEQGEERFTVEWHAQDDAVYYELLAFARPRQLMARLAPPLVRLVQTRFAGDSYRAMAAAVGRAAQNQ